MDAGDGASVLTYEHRSSAGVYALVAPWNMPLYLLTWKVAPCLAFGCTAVAKPSEVTSVTACLLAAVLQRAGVPAGVVNIVLGDGPTTGAALVASPRVAGVSFTGGTATGIAIRRATAHQIAKHVSLELGGKNPTLVFADAMRAPQPGTAGQPAWDSDRTVRVAAAAAFENQGEICLCGSRIYVEARAYDDFVDRFVRHVAATYALGEGGDGGSKGEGDAIGAVASAQHYAKIRGYLQLARDEGATFRLGGVPDASPDGGYWIAPTVLTDVAATSAVARDEIFGPVVTITRFGDGDEAEAVRLANDSEYGLAAVVLTRDGARMRRVAEQLDAGMVWINGWLQRDLATPFGGMKASGTGREGGDYSRDVFTVVRTVHLPNH